MEKSLQKTLSYVAVCALGILIGFGLAWLKFTRASAVASAPFFEVVDNNNDSVPDSKYYYDSGILTKSEHDRNFDGKADDFVNFTNGIISTAETDDDFDGKIDGWSKYRNGNLAMAEYDCDFNGIPDAFSHYTNGILNLIVWRPNRTKITRLELYVDGNKSKTYSDTDGNELFDTLMLFDEMENLLSTEKLSPEMPWKGTLEDGLGLNPAFSKVEQRDR